MHNDLFSDVYVILTSKNGGSLMAYPPLQFINLLVNKPLVTAWIYYLFILADEKMKRPFIFANDRFHLNY